MKKLKFRISTIIVILILVSGCSRHTNNEDKDTPKALQNNSSEVKSYRGSSDLVEELYKELVDKSQSLKKLEDSIEAIRPQINEAESAFSKYDSKSKDYYNSANSQANGISDSVLKQKIQGIISVSNTKYSSRTSELNSLEKIISRQDATLSDYHIVLKIVLTLPIIEKYQKDNMIQPQEFKALINKQLELINSVKKMTPTY